jgi:hypothetical protein
VSTEAPLLKDKLFVFINSENDDRSDLGQSLLPNKGSNAVNEPIILKADLDEVQSALATIGSCTQNDEGFTSCL